MPIIETEFTCPNNHTFKANAKLRARCPTCGILARRGFTGSSNSLAPEPQVTGSTDQNQEPKSKPGVVDHKSTPRVQLIRAGRSKVTVKKKPAPKPMIKTRAIRTGTVSNGIVRTHRVTGGATPAIKHRPRRTSVAGTSSALRPSKPFWHDVAEWLGFK